MATRSGASHATTRSERYSLGPGAELPVARIVALLLILLPIGLFFVISNVARQGPSQEATDLASFNPRSLLADSTPHFLPTPVAALPAEVNAGPPAPAESDQVAADRSHRTGKNRQYRRRRSHPARRPAQRPPGLRPARRHRPPGHRAPNSQRRDRVAPRKDHRRSRRLGFFKVSRARGLENKKNKQIL